MTGLPNFNYFAFNAAAVEWRKRGYVVLNPAENDADDAGDTTKPREHYMRQDIASVLACDAVAVLPNWDKSSGAKCEVEIAKQLCLPIYDALTGEPLDETGEIELCKIAVEAIQHCTRAGLAKHGKCTWKTDPIQRAMHVAKAVRHLGSYALFIMGLEPSRDGENHIFAALWRCAAEIWEQRQRARENALKEAA